MFDIGFSELLLTAVVGLLVLGPERLPRAAKMCGLWLRRARASWYSVKTQFERELADEELRRSLQQTRSEFDGLRQDLQQPLVESVRTSGSGHAATEPMPAIEAPGNGQDADALQDAAMPASGNASDPPPDGARVIPPRSTP